MKTNLFFARNKKNPNKSKADLNPAKEEAINPAISCKSDKICLLCTPKNLIWKHKTQQNTYLFFWIQDTDTACSHQKRRTEFVWCRFHLLQKPLWNWTEHTPHLHQFWKSQASHGKTSWDGTWVFRNCIFPSCTWSFSSKWLLRKWKNMQYSWQWPTTKKLNWWLTCIQWDFKSCGKCTIYMDRITKLKQIQNSETYLILHQSIAQLSLFRKGNRQFQADPQQKLL